MVWWTEFVAFAAVVRAEYLMVDAEAVLVINGVDGRGDWDWLRGLLFE